MHERGCCTRRLYMESACSQPPVACLHPTAAHLLAQGRAPVVSPLERLLAAGGDGGVGRRRLAAPKGEG